MPTNSNGEGAPSRSSKRVLRINANVTKKSPEDDGPHQVSSERRRRHRIQKKRLIDHARQLLLAPRNSDND